MATETKPRTSIKEKAQILRNNGVYVLQWIDHGESEFYYFPIIWFRGDDNEGERAVKILQSYGVQVAKLNREYNYSFQSEPGDVVWSLIA